MCKHFQAMGLIALWGFLAMTQGFAADSRKSVLAHEPDLAQLNSASATALLLRSGIFDPVTERLNFTATGAAQTLSSRYAIVQFQADKLTEHARLEQLGVQFVGYVPNNAYQVRLNGVDLSAIRADPAVRWAGHFEPGMKLDPALWATKQAALQPDLNGDLEIEILAFAGEPTDAIVAALKKYLNSVEITDQHVHQAGSSVRVRIHPGQLAAFINAASAASGVAWISPYYPPRLWNSGAIGAIQNNDTATCPGSGYPCVSPQLWFHNLFGSGQIVGIADSGLDHNEAWFTTLDSGFGPYTSLTDAVNTVPPAVGTMHPGAKIYAYWVQPGATAYDNNAVCPGGDGAPTSYHGTHTSGTIAGDAVGTFGSNTYYASSPTADGHDLADGMAGNAELLFQDIGDDTTGCLVSVNVADLLEQAYRGGARIHSDSWGGGGPGAHYTGEDASADYEMWLREGLLMVVAAGNNGSGMAPSTIGSPGNAKNALTVGALGHAGSLTRATFSSNGPTADGRFKPEIMAPGRTTVSALGNTNNSSTTPAPLTQALDGTSMATPTIAGNLALVRQYFTEGFYPTGDRNFSDVVNPSGSLLKAVVLNGTNPMIADGTVVWPNNRTGWGRMWSDGSIWFNLTYPGGGDDNRRMRYWERTNASGLVQNAVDTYTLNNVAADQELRVTLTWADPDASLTAMRALVNNLDLEVVAPDHTLYRGNAFDLGGVSNSTDPADTINTVETVRLPTPQAGIYTLRVRGRTVPGNGRGGTDRQGYALVASGDFGLPDPGQVSAPFELRVDSNNTSGVAVSYAPSMGADSYQLYRADGGCQFDGDGAPQVDQGEFHLVATGDSDALPIVDNRTQGGFLYAYEVRAVGNDVESEHSECMQVTSNDTCSLTPTFSQSSFQRNQQNSTCSVQLNWTAGSPTCPTVSSMHYQITRYITPTLTGTPTVFFGIMGTSYNDTTALNGQPYYYVIRAIDGMNNASESISQTVLNATTTGLDGIAASAYLDDVDTHTYMDMTSPWQVSNTIFDGGAYSYRSASGAATTTYPDLTCGALTTPPILIGAGSILHFNARYDLEYQWDGVALEISTNNGSTWSDLPPDGGYPNTFAQTQPMGLSAPLNACGYAPTHGAFTGITTPGSNSFEDMGTTHTTPAVFKPFTVDLSQYEGRLVRLRWRFSSDPGASFEGFSLDDVSFTSGGVTIGRVFANSFESAPNLTCQ